jgi:hypothetical protein
MLQRRGPLRVPELSRHIGNRRVLGEQGRCEGAGLDRLAQAKEVVQIAAVIGAEFSYELLRVVHPISEEKLQTLLVQLADTEVLYVRGIAPDATYQFKHPLIHDAAHEALLKSRPKEIQPKDHPLRAIRVMTDAALRLFALVLDLADLPVRALRKPTGFVGHHLHGFFSRLTSRRKARNAAARSSSLSDWVWRSGGIRPARKYMTSESAAALSQIAPAPRPRACADRVQIYQVRDRNR